MRHLSCETQKDRDQAAVHRLPVAMEVPLLRLHQQSRSWPGLCAASAYVVGVAVHVDSGMSRLSPVGIQEGEQSMTTYHTININGLNVFYRAAGTPGAPAVLLLHGFPTSSHMFRGLIPHLAGHYYVVA